MSKFLRSGLFRGLTVLFAGLFALLAMLTVVANANAGYINQRLGLSSTKIENISTDEDEDLYTYKSKFDNTTDYVEYREQVASDIQSEGTVLLKQTEGSLPLASGSNITFFGMGSYAPSLGGTTGSSAPRVSPFAAISLREAFEECGLNVNATMWNFYEAMSDEYKMSPLSPAWTQFAGIQGSAGTQQYNIGEVPVSEYTNTQRDSYSSYSDAAVVVITRQGTEADDFSTDPAKVTDGDGVHTVLALSQNERDMIAEAKACSENVIVLLNAISPLEIHELVTDSEIDSILWVGTYGTVGARGIAEVISGEKAPSGKLPDTFAVNSQSSPAMVNFGDYTFANDASEPFMAANYSASKYLVETENIYVGYKYYETRYADSVMGQGNADSASGSSDGGAWNYANEVDYSFGYGLSYTTFAQSFVGEPSVSADGRQITFTVNVQNTGDYAGKSVVQIYAQSPYTEYDKQYGVEKAAVQLLDFGKTGVIEPGDSETVTITANLKYLASYDSEGAQTYIFEEGDYYFALGNGAHDALNNILAAQGYDESDGMDYVNENYESGVAVCPFEESNLFSFGEANSLGERAQITNQFDDVDLNNLGFDITYLSRSDWQGTWPVEITELVATGEMATQLIGDDYQVKQNDDVSGITFGADTDYQLSMMAGAAYDDPNWGLLLDQLTLEDACYMVRTGGDGIQPITSTVMPEGMGADGPNGIIDVFGGRQLKTYWTEDQQDDPCYVAPDDPYADYECGTFPNQPVVAATFNKELVSEMGLVFGEDSLWSNTTLIFAPGLNTHRTPYNGRNQEYYSEDSMLCNLMGAAMIGSAYEEYGLVLGPKHFAFNDQETNRSGLAVFMNEQKAREGELRAFEGAYTEAGCKYVMVAYNRVGCTWVGQDAGLIAGVMREEWQFEGVINTDMSSNPDLNHPIEGLVLGLNLMLAADRAGETFTEVVPDNVSGDATVLSALRESAHRVMYVYVNSNLMNGTSRNAHIVSVINWWQYALVAADIVLGVIMVGGLGLLTWSVIRSKKDEEV